jgi:hypothetical protein
MAARSVMVRIDEDQAEHYRARAEGEDRSLSAEIRQALRRDLQRGQPPEPEHEGEQLMPVPARAKGHLEQVTALSKTATAAEAKQAAEHLRLVADDLEVEHSIRQRASRLAFELSAAPSAEDMARREVKVSEAAQFSRMNI